LLDGASTDFQAHDQGLLQAARIIDTSLLTVVYISTYTVAMGMFDTIRCLAPLLEPRHQALSFQTKDLDCLLDEYTITRAGHLVREPRTGWLARGPSRRIAVPLHGDVRMYTSVENKAGRHTWVEYRVRFTAGRVEWIRREPPGRRAARRRKVLPSGKRGALVPRAGPRRIAAKEFARYTPDKLELVNGRIVGDERLLLLILSSVGLRHAIELLGPETWQDALWLVKWP
jgi:hypothetical protein